MSLIHANLTMVQFKDLRDIMYTDGTIANLDAKLPTHLPYNVTDRELCLEFRCK